jgi:hypothetical protein
MTRCPDCPRTAPLKRLVSTTDKNGNLGREFVKCESRPEPGKVRSEFTQLQLGSNLLFLIRIWDLYSNWDFGFSYLKFQDLPKCGHFEWLDVYIERIRLDCAPRELENTSVMEHLASGDPISAGTVGYAEVKAELKKINKQMKHIIELKKQGNVMAGIFYLCAIFLCFVYLLIISR